MREKVAMITGASGEVGQALIQQLAERRRGKIVTLDLKPLAPPLDALVTHVPGSILDGGCSGTNQLIQRGEAKLVLKAADILEELNLSMVSATFQERVIVPGDATERELLKQLSDEPVHVDEIARVAALPIAQVTGALTLMELKGMVRQAGGMSFVLAHEAGVRYVVD